MFEKIRKMKNQKGFTLVELIVVLVILAILAALLVPALTGYIDKANKEKVIATTRMVVMAAQTEISEKYGLKASGALTATDTTNGTTTLGKEDGKDATGGTKGVSDGIDIANIAKLAEVADKDGKFVNGVKSISVTYDTKGHVTGAVVEQSGFTCTYNANAEGDKYTVPDKA